MDDNRLWFTFSCRGIDIFQSAQGVLSVDPSVFDVRFEGMIMYDHGEACCEMTMRRTCSIIVKRKNGVPMPAILVAPIIAMDVQVQD